MSRCISHFAVLLICLPLSLEAQNPLTITAGQLPPTTTTNVKSVHIVNLNIFRYSADPVVQEKTGAPAALPAGFTSPAAAGAPVAAKMLGVAAPVVSTGVIPVRAAVTFAQLQQDVSTEAGELTGLTTQTQLWLNYSAKASACYKDLLNRYPQLLLTDGQEKLLVAELTPGTCFNYDIQSWPVKEIGAALQDATNVSLEFAAINDAAHADQIKSLLTTHTATQSGLQALLTSSNATTLNTAQIYVERWRARQAYALTPATPWDRSANLSCHAQWFGKTDGQIVSIAYYDMSQDTPTAQSMALFTNSCLAALTVTSGIGLSTVRNSTYGFVPKTDYTASPPTTTQVIGYAADSRVVPLYVGQLNYEYARIKGLGFDISGGAGVGSSAAGTTGDFYIGHGFSFAKRAIFVTPSFHLTQRQTLLDGYAVGNPQAGLQTVPTINRWQHGFLITFTFPVLATN